MSKLFKKENGIRYQYDDTNTGEYTTIPYMTETILTVVGPDINVSNPIDPNMDDFTIVYANVTSPVTANAQELVDLMYCWIADELPNVITMLTDTPVVFDADCNALQNFGNDLYWRGQLLSGGGGGGLTTASNGLTAVGVDVQLGGTVTQPTSILLDTNNSFQILSPIGTGGNTTFYSFPVVPDQGIIGMSGTAGSVEIDSAIVKIAATASSQLNIRTNGVMNSTSTVGQVLTLTNAVTGECEYQNVGGYTEITVNITDTEILSMGTNPIELLPAPGVGLYYDIDRIILKYFYNGNGYTVGEDLAIGDGNNNMKIIAEFFIADTVSTVAILSDISYPSIENTPRTLKTQFGTNPTLNVPGAGGTIDAIIRYRVLTF